MFQKAEKKGLYARIAVIGPSGSGKTMWSLKIAAALSNKRVGVIDTEHRSASKYADKFDFDVAEFIDSYSPQLYLKAISDARDHYDVLVIDSLTHAWSGQDGLLEQVDNIARRSKSRSSFHAWREVTPIHNKLVEAMLSFPGHLIVTMRSKTEYVQEKDDKGKTQIRKVGLQPQQRDGLEYEFDIVGDVDIDSHLFIISKSRCDDITDKQYHTNELDKLMIPLKEWMGNTPPPEPEPQPESKPKPQMSKMEFGELVQAINSAITKIEDDDMTRQQILQNGVSNNIISSDILQKNTKKELMAYARYIGELHKAKEGG